MVDKVELTTINIMAVVWAICPSCGEKNRLEIDHISPVVGYGPYCCNKCKQDFTFDGDALMASLGKKIYELNNDICH